MANVDHIRLIRDESGAELCVHELLHADQVRDILSLIECVGDINGKRII
jgi:hypothetical protein